MFWGFHILILSFVFSLCISHDVYQEGRVYYIHQRSWCCCVFFPHVQKKVFVFIWVRPIKRYISEAFVCRLFVVYMRFMSMYFSHRNHHLLFYRICFFGSSPTKNTHPLCAAKPSTPLKAHQHSASQPQIVALPDSAQSLDAHHPRCAILWVPNCQLGANSEWCCLRTPWPLITPFCLGYGKVVPNHGYPTSFVGLAWFGTIFRTRSKNQCPNIRLAKMVQFFFRLELDFSIQSREISLRKEGDYHPPGRRLAMAEFLTDVLGTTINDGQVQIQGDLFVPNAMFDSEQCFVKHQSQLIYKNIADMERSKFRSYLVIWSLKAGIQEDNSIFINFLSQMLCRFVFFRRLLHRIFLSIHQKKFTVNAGVDIFSNQIIGFSCSSWGKSGV